MIQSAKNKDLDKEVDESQIPAEKPAVDPDAATSSQEGKQLFHFSGSGIFRPLAVWAENEAKAMEAWLKNREPFE